MPMNRSRIGHAYPPGDPFEVTADRIKDYAAATSDRNPRYASGEVAPPLFGVVYSFDAMIAPVFDGDLNVDAGRLVHGEQDMTFHRLVKPGEKITSQVKVENIEDKGSGELLSVRVTSKTASGELVLSEVARYFIRGKGGGKKEEAAAAPAAPPPEPKYVFTATQKVDPDQSLRYGPASGDMNPIHRDRDFALAMGLPDIILHGMCTMAFAHAAIINHACDGDPARLKRFKVRFTKPVLNGDTLTIRAWTIETTSRGPVLGVEVLNQAGAKVIADGVAEIQA